MANKPRFIVAEVSKIWGSSSPPVDTLATRFDRVIEVNRARGYELHSWKLTSVVTGPVEDPIITETIVAVFEEFT